MLRNGLGALERAAFEPALVPPGLVMALTLLPAAAAGIVFFGLPAAVGVGSALAAGLVAALLSRLLGARPSLGPGLAALVAVALIGAGAGWALIAGVAFAGAGLEWTRERWTPRIRLHAGLAVFAIVFLASRDATAVYLNPPGAQPLAEPVRLAMQSFGGASAFDPVRLYLGNVPGPMLVTSLLAVTIGAAWMWYAGRLVVIVPMAFLAGAALTALVVRLDMQVTLDSGPAWFAAAILLGDRRVLPGSNAAKLLLGLAAGLAGVGARTFGAGIEAVFLAVAGLELLVAAVELGVGQLARRTDTAEPGPRFSFRRRAA